MKKILVLCFLLCVAVVHSSAAYIVQNITWTAATYVTVSGNNLTKTTSTSWNGGAFSTQYIGGNESGYVETTTQETNLHRMFGLSASNVNADYATIGFAIYLHSSNLVYVFENGANRGQFTTYTTGDVFRVSKEGTAIKYYKNGVLFYTSGSTTSATLYADTSLYEVGSTIYNAKIAIVPEPTSLGIIGLILLAFLRKQVR